MLLFCFLVYWSIGVVLFVGGNLGNDHAMEYNRRVVAQNGGGWYVAVMLVGTILWPLTWLLSIVFRKEIESDVRRVLFDNDRWHRVWNGGSGARKPTDPSVTWAAGTACCHKCGRQQGPNDLYAFEGPTADVTARATCSRCFR